MILILRKPELIYFKVVVSITLILNVFFFIIEMKRFYNIFIKPFGYNTFLIAL